MGQSASERPDSRNRLQFERYLLEYCRALAIELHLRRDDLKEFTQRPLQFRIERTWILNESFKIGRTYLTVTIHIEHGQHY